MGVRGLRPLAGGSGDVPPQNLKRGELLTPLNPPSSGTQSHGKPSANESGQKWGSRGLRPRQGARGMCPRKTSKGVSC